MRKWGSATWVPLRLTFLTSTDRQYRAASLPSRRALYACNDRYESKFLGYMALVDVSHDRLDQSDARFFRAATLRGVGRPSRLPIGRCDCQAAASSG